MKYHRGLRKTEARQTISVQMDHRARERGSFAVMGALWLLIALIVLGTIDIGHVFFVRRDLKRIADMASLAGTQTMDDACSQAPLTALNVAQSNGLAAAAVSATGPSLTSPPQPASNTRDAIAVQCGHWDTSAPPDSPVAGTSPYFSPMGSATAVSPLNAVWVQVTRSVPYFFLGPARTVTAMSTARETNFDTFGVSGTLASVGGAGNGNPCSSASSSSLTNALLAGLLGAGSGASLSLVSPQGLACTNVQLGDLATAAAQLGYTSSPTVSGLLGAQLTVTELAKVAVQALSNTSVANVAANVSASSASLGQIETLASANVSTPINIGGTSNPLLSLGLTNTQAAATSQINLLDLMTTSLEIAQVGQPAVSVGTNAFSLGGATASTVQIQIISPPTIVSGPPGYLSTGTPVMDSLGDMSTGAPRTQASQGEIGVYINLSLGTPLNILSALESALGLGGLESLLNNLLSDILGGAININLNLPIYLQIGNATAWLDSIQCAATKAASTIKIMAQPSIINLCIGNPPFAAGGRMNLSSNFSCTTPATLASVQLGSSASSLVSVHLSPIAVQVAPPSPSLLTFFGAPNPQYATVNTNALFSAVTTAVNDLAKATVTATIGSTSLNLSTAVLNILQPLLSPLFKALDSVLVPLLNTLGIQVGEATVEQIGLTCGAPQIVY